MNRKVSKAEKYRAGKTNVTVALPYLELQINIKYFKIDTKL